MKENLEFKKYKKKRRIKKKRIFSKQIYGFFNDTENLKDLLLRQILLKEINMARARKIYFASNNEAYKKDEKSLKNRTEQKNRKEDKLLTLLKSSKSEFIGVFGKNASKTINQSLEKIKNDKIIFSCISDKYHVAYEILNQIIVPELKKYTRCGDKYFNILLYANSSVQTFFEFLSFIEETKNKEIIVVINYQDIIFYEDFRHIYVLKNSCLKYNKKVVFVFVFPYALEKQINCLNEEVQKWKKWEDMGNPLYKGKEKISDFIEDENIFDTDLN